MNKSLAILLYVCMETAVQLTASPSQAQAQALNPSPGDRMNRGQLTLMVLPYTSGKEEEILRALSKDTGFTAAVSAINSALIDMGYTNTLDFDTYEANQGGTDPASRITRSDRMKHYIQHAPADVWIETSITWIDPPGNPRDRQARLRLKAIDRYTSAVYADDASIQSQQREFPNLSMAIEHALKGEGKEEFKKFLSQLDASYAKVMREGRTAHVKFSVIDSSGLHLSDRVGNERLADKIEDCVRRQALGGRYRPGGETDSYMEFAVQIPVVDSTGNSVTPTRYIRKIVDDYFYQLGFEVKYIVAGAWIDFILVKKEPPATQPKK